jgi:uncharacterized protein DUF4386
MSDVAAGGSDPDVISRYARYAGVALLLSLVFGALGESYLPGKIIVSGDAAATAANITAHPTLFRMAFATYLVEGFSDIILCVLWYIILKPVNRNLALISAFVGVVSMITFAIAQSSFWASSIILKDAGGMTAFTGEQRTALAYLSVRISAMIASLFLCFYGTASAIRGFLIMRSGYLPRVLGVLLMIGGVGFFLRSLTYILAPAYGSSLMLIPMAVAGIPLTFWMLVKGVDVTALGKR